MPTRHDTTRADPTLRIPRALAHGLLASGLTAPGLRAFIVMMSTMSSSGSIDILKPSLERNSGTRIDNAHRFLDALRNSRIDIPVGDDPSVGEAWFDLIDYTPGAQKQSAGVIRGQLSSAAMAALSHPERGGMIDLSAAELGRLSTVPGILLYLRLRSEWGQHPSALEITSRFTVEDAYGLMGEYCRAARSVTKNADGETSETLSISRVTATLLKPAVADVARAMDDMAIGLHVAKPKDAGRGKRWRHVDIVSGRLVQRPSLRELAVTTRAAEEYSEMMRRRRRSLKSDKSAQQTNNEFGVASSATGET